MGRHTRRLRCALPAPPAASPQVEDNAWTQRAPAGGVEGGPAATREENRAPQLTRPPPPVLAAHSMPTMGRKTAAAAALLLALVGSATAQSARTCQPTCWNAYQTLVRCPSCCAATLVDC